MAVAANALRKNPILPLDSRAKLVLSSLPAGSRRFPSVAAARTPLGCSAIIMEVVAADSKVMVGQSRPDSFGRFGKFGGKYVPETLMHALSELEAAFYSLSKDEDFLAHPRDEPYINKLIEMYEELVVICGDD